MRQEEKKLHGVLMKLMDIMKNDLLSYFGCNHNNHSYLINFRTHQTYNVNIQLYDSSANYKYQLKRGFNI